MPTSRRPWPTLPDFWDDQLRALIAHVTHQSRLDERVEQFTVRHHIEGRWKRLVMQLGEHHPKAMEALAELDGPPAPVALAYLLQWSRELYGRSGVGMNGLAPLAFSTIRDWARLTQRGHIAPHEVHALLLLDAIWMHPPKDTDHG